MKPDVILLAPLPAFLVEPLQEICTCHDYVHAPDPAALLAEVGERVRAAVIFGATVVSEELLDQLPALEIISVFGVGYDGVPLDYCRQRGLRLTNTPDVLTDDVADIAVALTLMCSRQLVQAERFAREGTWQRGPFPLTRAVRGKVAGILGLGRIGRAIATRLQAHGMSIAYHGRKPQQVDWQYVPTLLDLAEKSDFLIVACPGGPETQHLVDAAVLQALGPEGTVINIARGSVIDETALVAAIETGTIRGAGLDVFENEPHIPAALVASDRMVLLPHVGSGTLETRREMADLCVRNVACHFSGLHLPTPVL